MKIQIYVDGSCKGNPGPSGAGVVIFNMEGEVIKEVKKNLGVMTNNMAEYHSLLVALHEANNIGALNLEIFTDSDLMANQINKRWKVKHPHIKPLHKQVMLVLSSFRDFSITWIPRENNSHADFLSNEALKTLDGDVILW